MRLLRSAICLRHHVTRFPPSRARERRAQHVAPKGNIIPTPMEQDCLSTAAFSSVRHQFELRYERIFSSTDSRFDFARLSGMGDTWSAETGRYSC